jgi:hypothetical protein
VGTATGQLARDALDCAAGDPDAFAVQLTPDLAGAADAVVLPPDAADLAGQLLIAQGPCTRGPRPCRVAGRRGDRQHLADRLDSEARPVLFDESARLSPRQSSFAPKKAAAALRISLACRSSRTSRSSLLTRSRWVPESPLQALVGLGLAHPLTRGLGRHAKLAGHRADRRPLGSRSRARARRPCARRVPHFCWIPRCSAHGSVVSRTGASHPTKPGRFTGSFVHRLDGLGRALL